MKLQNGRSGLKKTLIVTNTLMAVGIASIGWAVYNKLGGNNDEHVATTVPQPLISPVPKAEQMAPQLAVAVNTDQAPSITNNKPVTAVKVRSDIAEIGGEKILEPVKSPVKTPPLTEKIAAAAANEAELVSDESIQLAALKAQLAAEKKKNQALLEQMTTKQSLATNTVVAAYQQELADLQKNVSSLMQAKNAQGESINSEIAKEVVVAETTQAATAISNKVKYINTSDLYNKEIAVVASYQKELVNIQNSIGDLMSEERAPSQPNKNDTEYLASLSTLAKEQNDQARIIEVQEGDTLWHMAKRAYGDGTLYTRIFSANPHLISNPDKIMPGLQLRVPV